MLIIDYNLFHVRYLQLHASLASVETPQMPSVITAARVWVCTSFIQNAEVKRVLKHY